MSTRSERGDERRTAGERAHDRPDPDRPPLVAVISGLAAAGPPAEQALREHFAEAVVWNLLDDRLIDDATAAGAVTDELEGRLLRLARHAALGGADGILLTCSLYSGLSARVSRSLGIPVLGPDEAAFGEVLAGGHPVVHLVSGVALALEDATLRLREAAAETRRPLTIEPVLVTAARAPSLAGDHRSSAEAIAAVLGASERPVTQVLLANYSLSPGAELLESLVGAPVVTGPVSAALRLRAALRRPVRVG